MSGQPAGFGWFFLSFALLVAAGALIGAASISFLVSLTPLYVSTGLSVAAVVCAMVALGRHTASADR